MSIFRGITPTHDPDREECEKYESYRGTLERDFNKRCGYCDDSNSIRIRSFAIDHFVPRTPIDFTHDIKPNYYLNLMYSCSYCNRAKSNKWPTKDAKIPNDGKVGFVNPTTKDYDSLFERDKDGTINAVNNHPLAIYIIENLGLKNPIHSLMWRFEKLRKLEADVEKKLSIIGDNSLILEHYAILKGYKEVVDKIFLTNDK